MSGGRGVPVLLIVALGLAACGGSTIEESSLKSCVEGEGAGLARASSDDLPSGDKQQELLTQGASRQFVLTSDRSRLGSGTAKIVLYDDESTAEEAAADPIFSKEAYPLKRQAKNVLAIATVYDEPDSKTRAIVEKCVA